MPYDSDAVAKGSTHFTISNPTSRPDAQAVQAIINAINALNLAQGINITFTPFQIACLPGTFDNLWNNQRGDQDITFFQSNGSGGNFLPLGDMAIVNQSLDPGSVPDTAGVLFAPANDTSVLAHPVGFNWILNDSGSGNSRNVDYFTINPPEGYVAMGIALNSSGAQPNVNNYWCVRTDLVRAVGAQGIWSDSGQHWKHHNGDVSRPVANVPMAEPYMLFAPPTLLSAEGGTPAYAVVMEQANLQITPFDAAQPTYDPTITTGDETSYGLTSVKIVPYTAVTDPGYLNQSTASPFYFVAAEPYFLCTYALSTPAGGSFQVTQTVGTSQSDSNTFSQETSLTVSADVGVAYGPASASVSASYTNSFGTSVSHTSDHSTQVQTQITLNLPAKQRTWIWERQTQISVFRTDQTQLAPVTYSEPDIEFVSSPS
ncbi:MAG TPA: Vps62-related protein [Thermoanaerobaculia bacterium]|nr:Vps62-related protein [Thermoanaerobaculia bacterium]